MKVCLLSPPDHEIPYHPPDLGLGYLASSLIDHDIDAVILNPNLYDTEKKILNYIINHEVKLVGIKIITRLFFNAAALLAKIKEVSPEIITVAGGPHPSGDPLNVKSALPHADYIFAGEAETGLPMLINKLYDKGEITSFRDIPGLVYESDGAAIMNPPFFDPKIDRYRMPAWELMPPSDYPVASMCRFFKHFPIAPIIATRGCAYNCIFCAAHCVAGKSLRLRNPRLIIEEIRYLYKKYGVREFQFVDDNLTLNNQHIKDVASLIIDSGIKISWSCPNGIRIDSVNNDILSVMAESGCHTVCIGVETGSSRMLKMINKSLSLETIEEKVYIMKKSGIRIIGMFIIGLPDEEEEDIIATVDFACRLPLHGASFMLCAPLPGSDIYNRYLKGRKDTDWGQIRYKGNMDYNYSRVSYKRLKQIQRRAFWKFHLRRHIILSTAASLNSPQHVLYFLRRISKGFLLS